METSQIDAVGSRCEEEGTTAPRERNDARGLLLVGVFKMSKAVFFTAVGAGALHLVHRDVGDVLMRVVDALRIDPENRFVNILMDKADLIGRHQLRQASLFSFLYAALCVVEGTGLILRKSWAEYFTVVLTTCALPWEGYELIERFAVFKVGLLLINVAVLLYLLAVLKRKQAAKDSGEGGDFRL